MGLFSTKYKGQITTWDWTCGERRYGWSCECGTSVSSFTTRRGVAESALRKHMKNEHGY
jgi:hypothetical protein